MAPRFKFAQELWPMGFSLAHEDHVRVRLRLIGHQSHMGSTQDHRAPLSPELIRDGIGVRRTRGMKGNGHQVDAQPEIYRPYHLIYMDHRPLRRCKGGKIRHGDLLEVQDATPP
jgi:hypothetical protein